MKKIYLALSLSLFWVGGDAASLYLSLDDISSPRVQGSIYVYDTLLNTTTLFTTMPPKVGAGYIAATDSLGVVTSGYPLSTNFTLSSNIYSFNTQNQGVTPTLLTGFSATESAIFGIALSHATSKGYGLYVNRPNMSISGVFEFNPTIPELPTLLFQLPSDSLPTAIAVSGTTGYISLEDTVSDSSTVVSFDLTNPTTFSALTPSMSEIIAGIAVIDQIGCLLTGIFDRPPAPKIYTFNPLQGGAPTLRATFTTSFFPTGITLVDSTHGYLSGEDAVTNTFGLLQFNPSSQDLPLLVSTLSVPDLIGIAVANGAFSLPPPSPPSHLPTGSIPNTLKGMVGYFNARALPWLKASLGGLNSKALNKALESISPARFAFPLFAVTSNQLSLSGVVADFLRIERFLSLSYNESGLVAGDFLKNYQFLKQKKGVSQGRDCGFSSWVEGFGGYARQKAQESTPGFNTRGGGLIAAIDYYNRYKVLQRIGGGLAYVYSNLHEEKGQGHAKINQELALIYTTFNFSQFYFDTMLWGGIFQIRAIRHIFYPGVEEMGVSHSHGYQCTPHLELGYNVIQNWWCLNPFVMFDWANNWERGFEEQGASFVGMGQKSRYSSMLRSEVGFRLFEMVQYGWGRLSFVEKASYVNKTSFKLGRIDAFLVGQSGSFFIETLAKMQNLGLAAFEIALKPNNRRRPSLHLEYQGEFGALYQSHQGQVTLLKEF